MSEVKENTNSRDDPHQRSRRAMTEHKDKQAITEHREERLIMIVKDGNDQDTDQCTTRC